MDMSTQSLSVSNGAEKGLRDPSFSSYLAGAERSFVLNMVKQGKATDDDDDDDEEIGVFSADRYFNEGLDVGKPKMREKPIAQMVLPYVDNPFQRTQSTNESRAMSVRSGSSRNSQAALLQGAVQSVNAGGKVRGRGGYLGSFRCRCICSDINSVAVEEYESCGESLTLRHGAAKEPMKKCSSPVTAEILGVYNQGPKRETHLIYKDLSIEDLPRKSVEVFGLPVLERRSNPSLPLTFKTEKKLRLNWTDEHQIPAETVIPKMAHGVYAESDSDASSDLFEIEDFSTGKVNPFLSRQVSTDISGSATPTAGYAPSEASIVWSVVTASAADFPITSDHEELRSVKNTTNSKTGSNAMNKRVATTGDKPRRLTSSFLACKSQDSVTVIDHAHKTCEKISDQRVLKSQDLESQVLKPQTEAMLTGFEPRNMRVGISSRSIAVSNSIHGPNMLYLK